MAFILPELPYAYDSLKEYIDEETMKIHHDLHHGGYVTKLNAALEGHGDLLEMDIVELLKNIDKVPSDKKQAVINNAGGHANHSLFWEIMSPDGGGEPEGELQNAIEEIFGSFEDFKNEFSEAAVGRFGSGWAWLAFDENKKLHIGSTANQDSPYLENHTPILGLDVWEHAYYLKYQNRRPEYIENWWNVVNWAKVAENFTQNS